MSKYSTFINEIRVRYADTDQMGYVYYGRYAEYFEVARVEALRSVGLSYKKVEDNGLMLPVYEYKIRYRKPVYYDALIEVHTRVKLISPSRIEFQHDVKVNGDVCSEASVVLVSVDANSKRPIPVSDELKTALNLE